MSADPFVVQRPEGSISVTPAALTRLVVAAAEAADGARVRRPRRGLELTISGGRAEVSLELAARYGVALPELAREVQERVSTALERMCGLEVGVVNVSVEEVER